MTKVDIIFEMGKKWILRSDLRHIDRTAFIFYSELESMGELEKAEQLYKIYEELT